MPIYEYRCGSCGHELEVIQKVSDDPLTSCPVCEQDTLRKKISAAGFRLKGSGWYETDFKSGSKKNVSAEDKAGGSGDGASEGGASSKADGKAESEGKSKTKSSEASSGKSEAS